MPRYPVILFFSPPPDASIAGVFQPMDKPDTSSGPDKGVIFVCHRHKHVPVLHIRKARSVKQKVSVAAEVFGLVCSSFSVLIFNAVTVIVQCAVVLFYKKAW